MVFLFTSKSIDFEHSLSQAWTPSTCGIGRSDWHTPNFKKGAPLPSCKNSMTKSRIMCCSLVISLAFSRLNKYKYTTTNLRDSLLVWLEEKLQLFWSSANLTRYAFSNEVSIESTERWPKLGEISRCRLLLLAQTNVSGTWLQTIDKHLGETNKKKKQTN